MRITVFVLAAALLSAGAARARAAERCHVIRDLGDSSPPPEWVRAIEALDRAVDASSCSGVALILRTTWNGLRVDAIASDGTMTTRTVSDPDGLVAVAYGLFVRAPPEAPTAPEPPTRPPEPAQPRAPPTPFVSRIDVGAYGGARAGFPTEVVMSDFEFRADVFVHAWLLTISVRASPFSWSAHLPADLDAYQEAALGLGLGRELTRGASRFAFTVEPNITSVWMANDAEDVTSAHPQLRIAGVFRWAYDIQPKLALALLCDAEIAPVNAFHDPRPPGLPPYPVAAFGLRAGIEIGL